MNNNTYYGLLRVYSGGVYFPMAMPWAVTMMCILVRPEAVVADSNFYMTSKYKNMSFNQKGNI